MARWALPAAAPEPLKLLAANYRWLGQRRTASCRVFPAIGLADARGLANCTGASPSVPNLVEEGRSERMTREAASENKFEETRASR